MGIELTTHTKKKRLCGETPAKPDYGNRIWSDARLLFGGERYDAAAPIVELGVVDVVAVWHFEAVGHEVGTRVALALAVEGFIVDAVELVDDVLLIGIEALHLDAGEMLVLHCLELVPEIDGLGLILRHVHQRREIIALVGRVEAVEVAELDNGSDGLVVADDLLAERSILSNTFRTPFEKSSTAFRTYYGPSHPAKKKQGEGAEKC